MTKSPAPTLAQLVSSLQQQGTELTTLRMALDLQFKRIAQLQAELDGLPQARAQRRQTPWVQLPSHSGNGNGHHRRQG